MDEWITSLALTEMTVIVLMDGVRGKVAKRNSDGRLELKEMSTIKQFLNPNNERSIMRTKLADRLCDTVEYYLYEPDHPDACQKVIIFLYAVSGVDLSFWFCDVQSDHKYSHLLTMIRTIYHAFCGKEKLARSEIQNLVYERAFGPNWRVEPVSVKIPAADYSNILDGYLHSYMARDQFLLSLSEENMLHKYGNYFDFDDQDEEADAPAMTYDAYQQLQYQKAIRLVDFLKYQMKLLKDLQAVKYLRDLVKTHPKLKVTDPFSHQPITDRDPHWKENIFCANFYGFQFSNAIKEIFTALCFSNEHIINHAYFSVNLSQLERLEKEYHDVRIENRYLIASYTYQEFVSFLKSYTAFLHLEVRLHTEKGTFGCFHCRHRFMNHHTTDLRDFVQIMIRYLFYGKSNVIGKEASDHKHPNWKYKLTRRDTVYKYLTGQQDSFTNKVSEALYYRILYCLHPEKRFNDIDIALSPSQFIDQLWQLFYYVFQVDFYMLRDTKRIPLWEDMIRKLFSAAVDTENMQTLQSMAEQFYIRFQIETEGNMPSRFTPQEMDFIQEQNTRTWKDYDTLSCHLKECLPEHPDTSDLISRLLTEWTDEKLSLLRDRMRDNIDLLSKLVQADEGGTDAVTILEQATDNRKCILYTQSIQNNAVLSEGDLERYLYYLRLSLHMNNAPASTRLNTNALKNELWYYMVQLSKMYTPIYRNMDRPPDSERDKMEKQVDAINIQLLDSTLVMKLQQTIRNTYLFLLYREWLGTELDLT